jgi:hypothetical protein
VAISTLFLIVTGVVLNYLAISVNATVTCNTGVYTHSSYSVDYTYKFDQTRFAIIFLLSGTLFQTAVSSVAVAHGNDNMSGPEPMLLTHY